MKRSFQNAGLLAMGLLLLPAALLAQDTALIIGAGEGLYGGGPGCLSVADDGEPTIYGGVQTSVGGPFEVRVSTAYDTEGRPWPPPPDLADRQPPTAGKFGPHALLADDGVVLAAGATLSGAVDLVLPISLRDAFELNLFLGAGLEVLNDIERTGETESAYILEGNTAPMLSFGGSLGFQVTDCIDLFVEWRSRTVFVGSQTYLLPEGASLEVDVDPITGSVLLFGLAVRL